MATKSFVYRGHEVWLEVTGLRGRALLIKKNAKMVKKVKYTMSGPDGHVSAGARTMSQANQEAMDWIDEAVNKAHG